MIRHIVVWRLAAADAAQRAADAAFVKESLEGLNATVSSIGSLAVVEDVALTEGNWDLALISEFADHGALDEYQSHPDHLAVVAAIKPLLAARAAIDFEA